MNLILLSLSPVLLVDFYICRLINMIRNYSLNWDYISRRVWFFRIPQYTYSLKLIFRVTLDATRAYAKQYYFVTHSMPVTNSKSSDLLPLQSFISNLDSTVIKEILETGF